MALTPAEVHNVAFKKPPIGKRGYDEEEVDAFLDVVEVELARLIEENNDLRSRASAGQGSGQQDGSADQGGERATGADPAELASLRDENGRLQSRVQELEAAAAQAPAQGSAAVAADAPHDGSGSQASEASQQQLAALQQQLAQTEEQLNANRAELERAQAELSQAHANAQAPAAAQGGGDPTSTGSMPAVQADHHIQAVQMLAMAQQTADQHLAQSKAEAERLVTEAQSHAQSTVDSANEHHSRTVAEAEQRAKQLDDESSARANQTVHDAEQRAATITAQFEQRKEALERRVEELRTFEREYRTRLKSYLESQLRDLDASGRSEPASSSNEYAEAPQ